MAKIEKEEDEREEFIEKRKEKLAAVEKNPVVEASEAAEEAHEAEKKAAFKAQKEAEAAAEAAEKARIAAFKAQQKAAANAEVKANAELWTANMPAQYLEGYIQTQVDSIRHQLA